MKYLKIIGIAFAGLVGLLLVLPAVLPTSVTVTRSAEINAPSDSVYAYISDFKNFTKWSPWYEYEPTAKVTVDGSGVGSVYAWVGKEVGTGSMTITSLDPGKNTVLKLEFTAPWQSIATTNWATEPTAGGTKITWGYSQEMPYFQRYFGLGMDKMLGPDFEKGLANLNRELGKK
jgi:uncharacterized protein YndB with AHSA1/START domain